jgi:hypothetical protein
MPRAREESERVCLGRMNWVAVVGLGWSASGWPLVSGAKERANY